MSILIAMSMILENKTEIKYQNHLQTEIITTQAEIGTEEIAIECTKNKMITKDLTINTNKSPIPISEVEMNKQLATNTVKYRLDNNRITILDLQDRPIERAIFQDNMAVDIDAYELNKNIIKSLLITYSIYYESIELMN